MKIFNLFALLFLMTMPMAHAQDASVPAIEIISPYAFATAPGAMNGAAFMVIQNNTNADDTLIAAKSDVAAITEIHQNLIDPDDGMMMMRKIKSLAIPAAGQALLEPKGYHIMVIKLKEPLTLGQTFALSLTFEKAGVIDFNVPIIQAGTKPTGHEHDMTQTKDRGFFKNMLSKVGIIFND